MNLDDNTSYPEFPFEGFDLADQNEDQPVNLSVESSQIPIVRDPQQKKNILMPQLLYRRRCPTCVGMAKY